MCVGIFFNSFNFIYVCRYIEYTIIIRLIIISDLIVYESTWIYGTSGYKGRYVSRLCVRVR